MIVAALLALWLSYPLFRKKEVPAYRPSFLSAAAAESSSAQATFTVPSLTTERDPIRRLREMVLNPLFDSSILVSKAYCLLDFESGLPIAGRNAEERLAPASLTKVMTALLVLENEADLTRELEILPEDLDGLAAFNASVAGFAAGDLITLKDLLHGILLPSGADACYAAARDRSGSREAFVALMNQRARALGLKNTHFTNPTGLPEEGLFSSARDMAELFYRACQEPRFLEISGRETYDVNRKTEDAQPLELISTFFWKFHTETDYQNGVLAGKSGYTGSEQCLATLFEKQGRRYVLVTLGAETDDPAASTAVRDQIAIMNQLVKD